MECKGNHIYNTNKKIWFFLRLERKTSCKITGFTRFGNRNLRFMKLTALLFLVFIGMSACRQGPDYTCICRDQGGGYGDQQYTIKADDQSIASYECEKYAVSLNSGAGDYNCTLH